MEHTERDNNRGIVALTGAGEAGDEWANIGTSVDNTKHTQDLTLCGRSQAGHWGHKQESQELPPPRPQFYGEGRCKLLTTITSDMHYDGRMWQVAEEYFKIPQLWFKSQLHYLLALQL